MTVYIDLTGLLLVVNTAMLGLNLWLCCWLFRQALRGRAKRAEEAPAPLPQLSGLKHLNGQIFPVVRRDDEKVPL